jgi:hypothetical protein
MQENNESWFWDALSDLHDEAKRLIAQQLTALAK